ncbi:hypothetical protein FANTH_2966 [Fusarium anthophilum]|uniref:SnoaL-like domain-containing protein n=1 Tax=Fusarium anthophilum TaxID=48485 RepID=A0A8H4ZSJ5_9HYPO|nr:hypothetical protein FANTH_2966 [Fusarium anthophilum]
MALHNSSSTVEARLAAVERLAQRAYDRGEVENLFSKYMHLHNVFQDEQIKALWVKRGTPGIHAQYTNVGVYTDYDSIMAYHSDRPSPPGKLILHETTTPLIEVAGDGETAKGFWLMAGVESGLADPKNVGTMPKFLYEPEDKNVDGKRVWTHWVWCHYALDFLKQDGQWKIWHFRCLEVTRAPFSENWITFAKKNQLAFDKDLAYFGNDGKAVFMPTPDARPEKADVPISPAPKPSPLTAELGQIHCSFHHRPNASSIARATEMFSDSQLERLALLERVFSSISLVAVLLIFVTFMQSDAWWSLGMSVNTFRIVFFQSNPHTFNKWLYSLICFGGPFISGFTLFFISTPARGPVYGATITWCWIRESWVSIRLFTSYLFVWICIATSIALNTAVGFRLFRARNQARGILNSRIQTTVTDHQTVQQTSVKWQYISADQQQVTKTNTHSDVQGAKDMLGTAVSNSQKLASKATAVEPISASKKQQSSSSATGSTKSKFWLRDPVKRAYLFTTFMFTLSVLVTWVPASITRIQSLLNGDVPYSYQVAIAAVMPLQGLWNALIFFTTSRNVLNNVIRENLAQRVSKSTKIGISLGEGEPTERLRVSGQTEITDWGSDVELRRLAR